MTTSLWDTVLRGFPGASVSEESTCSAGDHLRFRRPRFDPWVETIPWRGKWQPAPVFSPGKSHGQRSLVHWSSWCHKRVRHDLETKPPLFFVFFLVLPVYCYQPISLHPCAHMLSHVTPWTAACRAPLSMDFSRQEYWSGLPFPSP